MSHTVIEMNCPGCGARVSTGQSECEWCHKPIIISTFNSVYSMPMPEVNKYAGAYKKALSENPDDQVLNNSIAMCYLKLKLYDKALSAFEKAMEDNFDNSETFFTTPPPIRQSPRGSSCTRALKSARGKLSNSISAMRPLSSCQRQQ